MPTISDTIDRFTHAGNDGDATAYAATLVLVADTTGEWLITAFQNTRRGA